MNKARWASPQKPIPVTAFDPLRQSGVSFKQGDTCPINPETENLRLQKWYRQVDQNIDGETWAVLVDSDASIGTESKPKQIVAKTLSEKNSAENDEQTKEKPTEPGRCAQ